MSVWINFDYLSIGNKICQDEIDLVKKRSNANEDVARNIVKVGAELRRQYKSGDLPYGPSPGDLINWAVLVSDGCPPPEAAEETIICTTSDDPEVQEMVRRVVRANFRS